MKKTTKKDEFELVNLPKECQDPSISKDDFKLVQVDAKIHDQKFETKPTTFLKDCIKRFRKNKSSVVAAFILGFLVLMSLVVPLFKGESGGVHDTNISHPELYYLEPKLFDAGTGFWDGTKKMENIIVDTSKPRKEWGPDEDIYNPNAVSELKIGEEQYTDTPNEYAHGGYVQVGYFANKEVDYVSYQTQLSVPQMVVEEAPTVYPDDKTAKDNIVSIDFVYHPDKLEQKSLVDIDDFSADITFKPAGAGPEDPNETMRVSVDSVTLDTSSVGTGIEGSVKVGSKTATFTIDIIEKQYKELDFSEDLLITNFVTLDEKALKKSGEETKTYPNGYSEAKSGIFLTFARGTDTYEVQVVDYKSVHNIGSSEPAVNVTNIFKQYCDDNSIPSYKVTDIQLEIRILNEKDGKNRCTLIKSIEFSSSSLNPNEKARFESYSFNDGNEALARTSDKGGVWIIGGTTSSKYTKVASYLVRAVMCSFVYDTYEAVLGAVKYQMFKDELETYYLVENGDPALHLICNVFQDPDTLEWVVDKSTFECKILDAKRCPFVKEFTADDVVPRNDGPAIDYVNCEVYRYKMDPYNLDSMPRFLMGTDKTGRDMFIYVFEGLRTSLLLGIATSAVCFLFGLLWGSIAGYFGGNVDLVMERFTDILSGVPWIVVMTLTIIHLGSTFITFAIALCLTGWIGTAATTRTQFYRFRGREYVLASRTLGASHARLISKHILPNAMGTIITSAVLMVPSIIFSEATISYLGLGFKNLASLGVILSDNQVELTNHPYLLIFPAIIIALLMISFNLFGNGLRDAVNPSLKGEGE